MEKGAENVPSSALPTAVTKATKQPGQPIRSGFLQRSRDPDNRHGDNWDLEIPGRANVERCSSPALELVEQELYPKAEADPACISDPR